MGGSEEKRVYFQSNVGEAFLMKRHRFQKKITCASIQTWFETIGISSSWRLYNQLCVGTGTLLLSILISDSVPI